MDIRIGIRDSGREISFESDEPHATSLFIVPTEALGYVEIGAEEARRVGFIA
jgi:hypothetical protein